MTAQALVRDLALHWLQVLTILGIGLLLPTLFRVGEPGLRLRLWRVLLFVPLALPLLPWLLRLLPTGLLPKRLPHALAESVAVPWSDELMPLVAQQLPEVSVLPSIVLWILLLGLLGRLTWLALGARSLASIVGNAQRISEPAAQSAVPGSSRAHPSYYVSSEISTPVTFGWLRPKVILPLSFSGLSAGEQEAVLCHELMHVGRRDWLWVLFEEAIRALLWFHPLVWILLGRISLCREQVIDKEVIRRTARRKTYLEALLKVAGGHRQHQPLPATTMVCRNQLEQRVDSLLREAPMSKTHRTISLAGIATMLLLAVGAAGVAFPLTTGAITAAPEPLSTSQPQAPQSDESKPLYVTGDVRAPVKLTSVAPLYTQIAREARIQGVVIAQSVIDEEGMVASTKVLKGLPMGLSEAAVEALQQWRFQPATLHGEPVPVFFNVTVNFRLDEQAGVGERAQESTRFVQGRVQKPIKLFGPAPEYTQRAKDARIEGDVVLRLVINTEGRVTRISAIQGLRLGLSEAAAAAAYDWEFQPAILDGEPVEVFYNVTVSFKLD